MVTGPTGFAGPTGLTGFQGLSGIPGWRLTSTTVTIEASSSEGTADFTDIPSSLSLVVLAGYVVNNFYTSSKGLNKIFIAQGPAYWYADISLTQSLPGFTLFPATIQVFALAYTNNSGVGSGFPTSPITTNVYQY
jgi:hypothetical protein